jgi:transcription termination factor Rho
MSCAASSMPMGRQDAIEFLLDKLRQSKTNADFFDSMNT